MKIDVSYQSLKEQAENLMKSGDVTAYIRTLLRLQELRKNFYTGIKV